MWKIVYHTGISGFKDFKEITETEFISIENAVNFIKYCRVFEELFELLTLNFSDLFLYLVNISEKNRLHYLRGYDDLTEPKLICNQKLANILSSFRTYVDHINHQLSSRYGKSSLVYTEFDEKTKTLFDSYFSYRFFSKLRNYIQHYGMPITKISYNSSLDELDKKSIYYSTNIYVNKEDLLVYDGWGTILKEDFAKMKDEINLNNLLNEFFYTLILLYKSIRNQLENEFDSSKEKILSLHNECLLHSGEPINKYDQFGLTIIVRIEDKPENSGNLWVPIDMTKRVERLYNKHNINESNYLNSYTNTKF